MRCSLLIGVGLALCAAACDNTENIDGARGSCAAGGVLAGCPDGDETPEAACWRLIECGVMPLEARNDDGSDDPNGFDWQRCVNALESYIDDRARVVIACIASSTCDELQAPGSPEAYGAPACFQYGDR